jgi:hypothetical protein
VGDSAGAHFHIPPSYMNASQIQPDTFQDLVQILANEFDWPSMVKQRANKANFLLVSLVFLQKSTATGFEVRQGCVLFCLCIETFGLLCV